MLSIACAALLLLLAALPTALVVRNLPLFHRLPTAVAVETKPALISVLIPARNEQAGIAATLQAVLSNGHVEFEVIVIDDHSQDRTAAIVAQFAERDSRVRLHVADALPAGWNGKQHACWQAAGRARFELLLFLDADVRLGHDALHRAASAMQSNRAALLSGFPDQQMLTWSEKLLIPMMYFLLLGYLPLDRMRSRLTPALGAGCGQFFLARREAYFTADGHRSIRGSRHDGLMLPRSFRAAGFMTDLFDASDIASVRMYDSGRAVVRGLLKNATEGIANHRLIVLFSLLLSGGSVLPILMLGHAVYWSWPTAAVGMLSAATLLSFVPRGLIAKRLHHSWVGVVLHPVAVACFLSLQWYAWLREALGLQAIAWRGRR